MSTVSNHTSSTTIEADGRLTGLAEDREILQAIFSRAQTPIALFDASGRYTYLNPSLAALNGICAADHLGRTLREVNPRLAEAFGPGLARALRGERSSVVLSAGSPREPHTDRHWEVDFTPLRDRQGVIMGAMAEAHDQTAARDAQQKLAEAYAYLEALFEAAPVSLSMWDTDLRLTRANAQMLRWHGTDPAQGVGRHASDLLAGIWPTVEGYFRRALAGERCTVEVDRRGRGELTGPEYVEMSYSPVQQDGRIIGVVRSSTDISEHVHQTRALQEAYSQLEAVFDTTAVSIAVWDRDLNLVRANPLTFQWNGLDPATALGRHISDVFPAVWSQAEQNYLRALNRERFAIEVNRRARGQLSGPEYLQISYAPVIRNDQVVGVVVSAMDVTQVTAHARALEEAYAQLEAVFDNVHVAIALYDRDLRILRINDEMARWNQLDLHAVVGQRAQDVFGAQWIQANDHRRRALAGESCRTVIDRRAGGQVIGPAHVLASYTPVIVNGEVVGLTVSSTDITAQVSAAERAEAAIRFRDDLISIASHELRTPLTSLIGFSERLAGIAGRDAIVTLADARDDLALVRDESQRMARTLDLLLDLVGLAGGSYEVEREPVALAPLVHGQTRMVRERHPKLHVAEEIDTNPIVDSDGDRIAQVISNLLENAAKYAGEDAHVTIRVHVAGKRALIQVQDDGPGVPLEEQHTIFARRYRGPTNGTSGLGLGLYLSRTIAIRLGGTLSLASTPGHGATFTLALPYEPQM